MKQKHKYFYTKQTKKEPRPERDRWLKSRISHHYRKGSVYTTTYTSDNFGLYSCWRIDAFVLSCGRTLESPLDNKEIKPINLKGNQPWIVTGRTDAENGAPILWPPELTHWKRLWCCVRLKAGGEAGDRGWDVWMAITDSMGMSLGSLVFCSPWGLKESRHNLATEQHANYLPLEKTAQTAGSMVQS